MIRVLVVDDDFMVAKLHSTLVSRVPGFEVAGVAHSGSEALSLVRELAPDLVLLDLYLPDVSGLEVLRQLRGDGAPGGGPDVLVITAARDAASVRAARHGGAVQYVVKPFEEVAAERAAGAVRTRAQRVRAAERAGPGRAGPGLLPGRARAGGRRGPRAWCGGHRTPGVGARHPPAVPSQGPHGADLRAGAPHAGSRPRGGGPLGLRVRGAQRPLPGERPPLPGTLRRHRNGDGNPPLRHHRPPGAPLPPAVRALRTGGPRSPRPGTFALTSGSTPSVSRTVREERGRCA